MKKREKRVPLMFWLTNGPKNDQKTDLKTEH